MREKIILEIDANNTVYDKDGVMIGILAGSADKYEDKVTTPEMILSLIKQGVTAKEIIDLKNADLL
jgi:hypothetical protein